MKTTETITQHELNEAAIGNSLMQLFGIKDYKLNSGNYNKIDLFFEKNDTQYGAEIKCREKMYNGMLIERGKLIEMKKYIDQGYQVRYINYIESEDKILIFNINNRILKGELLFAQFDVDNIAYYHIIDLPNNQEEKKDKEKYVKYLYLDEKNMGDYVIENYTYLLFNNKNKIKTDLIYNQKNIFNIYQNDLEANYYYYANLLNNEYYN